MGERPLLLTQEHVDFVKAGLNNVIYWQREDDCLVRGTTAHGPWGAIVLDHDDANEDDDLDFLSGIVAQRLISIRDGDHDWSDNDSDVEGPFEAA